MAKTLTQVIASLPRNERRQIAVRAKELIAEEMTLRDLRKAIGKTQVTVAKRLRVGQDAVSKLETRGDMYISTLRGLLKAMGGELELVARFRDRPAVRLEELGAVSPRRKRERQDVTWGSE
jgi:transcriptional regulator with XRE-family HTH domain